MRVSLLAGLGLLAAYAPALGDQPAPQGDADFYADYADARPETRQALSCSGIFAKIEAVEATRPAAEGKPDFARARKETFTYGAVFLSAEFDLPQEQAIEAAAGIAQASMEEVAPIVDALYRGQRSPGVEKLLDDVDACERFWRRTVKPFLASAR